MSNAKYRIDRKEAGDGGMRVLGLVISDVEQKSMATSSRARRLSFCFSRIIKHTENEMRKARAVYMNGSPPPTKNSRLFLFRV